MRELTGREQEGTCWVTTGGRFLRLGVGGVGGDRMDVNGRQNSLNDT